MLVSSLLALLSLLVNHALHSRVELPPCQVPPTRPRYGFPSGNQSPGSLRSTSLSMAPELMATSFDSGSHWPSLPPSASATLADSLFGTVSHDFPRLFERILCRLCRPCRFCRPTSCRLGRPPRLFERISCRLCRPLPLPTCAPPSASACVRAVHGTHQAWGWRRSSLRWARRNTSPQRRPRRPPRARRSTAP